LVTGRQYPKIVGPEETCKFQRLYDAFHLVVTNLPTEKILAVKTAADQCNIIFRKNELFDGEYQKGMYVTFQDLETAKDLNETKGGFIGKAEGKKGKFQIYSMKRKEHIIVKKKNFRKRFVGVPDFTAMTNWWDNEVASTFCPVRLLNYFFEKSDKSAVFAYSNSEDKLICIQDFEMGVQTDSGRNFKHYVFDSIREQWCLQKRRSMCYTCEAPAINAEVSLNMCANCMMIPYCSKACQKLDWKYHKKECPKMKKKKLARNYDTRKEDLEVKGKLLSTPLTDNPIKCVNPNGPFANAYDGFTICYWKHSHKLELIISDIPQVLSRGVFLLRQLTPADCYTAEWENHCRNMGAWDCNGKQVRPSGMKMIDQAWENNRLTEDPYVVDSCKAMHSNSNLLHKKLMHCYSDQQLVGSLQTITLERMNIYKSGPHTRSRAMQLGFDLGELRHYMTYVAVLCKEERENWDMILGLQLAPFHTENGQVTMHIGEGFEARV